MQVKSETLLMGKHYSECTMSYRSQRAVIGQSEVVIVRVHVKTASFVTL